MLRLHLLFSYPILKNLFCLYKPLWHDYCMNKLIMLLLFSITTNAYALPDCPRDTSKLWDNCFGTINFADGGKYVGEWKNNTNHGQGTYTHDGGNKYVGEFKDGNRHGQGTFTFSNGDKYVGEYKENKKHGQGTYTYADGNKYVGEWKENKKHGQGTYTYASGNKYVGEYKDGNRHGQGTYTFADGEQQVGYHLNNKYIPTTCEAMGLVKGSSEFGQCVITLINKL